MRGLKMLAAICAVVLWSGVALAAPERTVGCAASQADEAAVVSTLRSMYAAAMVNDMARLHATFAPGAYLFDGGTRYGSIDTLMRAIHDFQAKGAKSVWKVTQPDVHVHCDVAWIAYVNSGSVILPGATEATPAKWLESADLEKHDGAWKIVFFQSTRVPSPAPAKQATVPSTDHVERRP